MGAGRGADRAPCGPGTQGDESRRKVHNTKQ